MDLEQATTLEPLGSGRFAVDLRQEFAIGGNKPNGGYMLTCLGRAVVAAAAEAGSPHAHPVSTGVSYLQSPDLGPAVVVVDLGRIGTTATQATARLVQDERTLVSARFLLGALHDASTPYWGEVPVPVFTPFDECDGVGRDGMRPANGVDMRFDPRHSIQFGPDGPTGDGSGELRAWFRFEDDRPVDPVSLLYVCDAMPPATFTIVQSGWVPTLDLTAYVRAVPAPGPLRIRFRVQVIQDGFADEVCEVWDSADRLVAQSTQICALRLPG